MISGNKSGTEAVFNSKMIKDGEQSMKISQEKEYTSKRARKRTLGHFKCPDCDKVFTRSDHLARHHLNHAPKTVYRCDYVIEKDGFRRLCGKTFVRRDLKERHMRRHRHPHTAEGQNELGANRGGTEILSSESPVASRDNLSKSSSSLHISNLVNDVTIPAGEGFVDVNSPLNTETYNVGHLRDENAFRHPVVNARHGGRSDIGMSNGHLTDLNKNSYNNMNIQSPNGILNWLFNDQSYPRNRYFGDDTIQDRRKQENNKQSHTENIPESSNNLKTSKAANCNSNDYNSHDTANKSSMEPSPQRLYTPSDKDHFSIAHDWNPNFSAMIRNMNLPDVSIFLDTENPLEHAIAKESGHYGLEMDFDNSSISSHILPFSPNETTVSSDSAHSSLMLDQNYVGDRLSANILPFRYNAVRDFAKHNSPQNKHTYINSALCEAIFEALGYDKSGREFEELFMHFETNNYIATPDRFSSYMITYWNIFHREFTILHKPSFDTKSQNPLLLAAMLSIGAIYASGYCFLHAANKTRTPEFTLATKIIKPLRFMLFQHKDFDAPVKLWVLQCLCLLEWSEKNLLLRKLHERAHLYHATIVQLMRRSPIFGGNPTTNPKDVKPKASMEVSEMDDSAHGENKQNDRESFDKWVYSEAMKRVTYMIFYSDAMDYIKYRHNPQISFYQMQLLTLPCDDEGLWESKDVNGSFRKVVKRQKKLQTLNAEKKGREKFESEHPKYDENVSKNTSFLGALKTMLEIHDDPVQLNRYVSRFSKFVKLILFAGLLCIMNEMNQIHIRNSFPFVSDGELARGNITWKDTLSKTFDNFCLWSFHRHANDQRANKDNMLVCQLPVYHLAMIIGMSNVNHYDISIFGGAPANMNVKASIEDYRNVSYKLKTIWSLNSNKKLNVNDLFNARSVVHCFLFLWEVFLKETEGPYSSESFIGWNFGAEYFDANFSIAISTLVLWSYVYSRFGEESQIYNQMDVSQMSYDQIRKFVRKEPGYYLSQVRNKFSSELQRRGYGEEYSIDSFGSQQSKVSPHNVICEYAKLLDSIEDLKDISGLCLYVSSKLINSQWDIIREEARLIQNCGYRSLGKQDVICHNFFEDSFE